MYISEDMSNMPEGRSKSISIDSYIISPLEKGFMAQCSFRPEISVYGETAADAFGKIEDAVREYEKVFKKKAK